MELKLIAPICALIALIVAFALSSWIKKCNEGNERMKEISGYIREGAFAFLKREYKFMIVVIVCMAILLSVFLKPTIGILSDILPIKKNHLVALVMFLFAPALILFASTTNPDMLFITGTILGVGAFMHSALTNALVIQSAAPHLRGTTAGFVNLFNQIGVMLAPMILGSMLTATGSYQSALMTLAIAPVIGAIALFFVRLK